MQITVEGGLDVYLIIEDDGSPVSNFLTGFMETFLKPFSEWDGKKLSHLVFGLVEAITQSFTRGGKEETKDFEECLEALGVSLSYCGLQFLLDSISFTNSLTACLDSIQVLSVWYIQICCGSAQCQFTTMRISWDSSSGDVIRDRLVLIYD